jgi:hypothetical protein
MPRLTTGIHAGLSFDDYLDVEAVNWSSLKLMADQSPAHARAAMDAETLDTSKQILGKLLHAAKFEPLSLLDDYVVMPAYELDPGNLTAKGDVPSSPRATKYYRDRRREFETANSNKQIVNQQTFELVKGLLASLHEHPVSRALFDRANKQHIEVTMVWDDPCTGLRCKGRVDSLCLDEWATIADLKSTRNASVKSFVRDIFRYQYHGQGAFYVDGLRELTGQRADFTIAAVETEGVYRDIEIYTLSEQWMQMGRNLYRPLLNDYAECLRNNDWPGYTRNVKEPKPEAWMLKEYAA